MSIRRSVPLIFVLASFVLLPGCGGDDDDDFPTGGCFIAGACGSVGILGPGEVESPPPPDSTSTETAEPGS